MFQKKFNEFILSKNYAIIKIKNNFKGNLDCLIDIEDIEKCKNFYWNIRYDKRHPKLTPYVETHFKGKRIHLHRFIMNCPDDKVIDHIDGNNLDNRKQNLRIVTQIENAQNRYTTNKHIGLYYNKRDLYWLVQRTVLGVKRVFGRYKNKEKAIKKAKEVEKLIKHQQWKTLAEMKCINISNRKRLSEKKQLRSSLKTS